MTFNEPELVEQANMSPLYAAERWAEIETIADHYNLKIVAPCGTIDKGFTWYQEWLSHCNAIYGKPCNYDYTCLHAYYQPEPCDNVPGWACASDMMNKVNNWASTFGKPTWVTEFACNPVRNPFCAVYWSMPQQCISLVFFCIAVGRRL